MIDISKILAGWISSWVENDLGGFRLGGKWLKVWVDFVEWKTSGGFQVSAPSAIFLFIIHIVFT